MHRLKKIAAALLSALMLMSALSGCAEQEKPEEERFVLRASVCATFDSLDPAMNTDTGAESIFCALFENLMRVEANEEGVLTAVPGIAKEYEEIVNFDGTVEYAFTLRSSAHWSDGTRVKSRDFVYAWRRLVDPETNSPNHALLSMVDGYYDARELGDASKLNVRTDGDSVFRVTLSAPCTYFLSEVCTAVATMPLRRDAIQKDAEWMTSVGVPTNGPYRVGAWARGESIQLRRNTSYYDQRTTGPDVLRFLFAPAGEAWQLYEKELVDYVSSPPRFVDATGFLPLRSTTCVLYNHVSEAFSNEHVRKAFDLTLDRAGVAAMEGVGTEGASGLVPPGVPDGASGDFRAAGGVLCAADKEGYAMRCLDAETQLRNGGYWGGTGFPHIKCLYVAGDEETRAAAAAAAGLWHEKLRVAVTTEGVTREELERRLTEGEYDAAVVSLRAEHGDASEYLTPFAGMEGNNLLHYDSKPVELLLGVAETSRDGAARTAFLHDAEALLLGDTALSPLYFGAERYVLREGLSGARFDWRGNVYFNAVTRTENAEARAS